MRLLNLQMLVIVYSSASNIVFSRLVYTYVGIDVLVASLQRVPYYLPTLLHLSLCTAGCIRAYDTVSALTHQLPTYRLHSGAVTNGNFHSFVVRCER